MPQASAATAPESPGAQPASEVLFEPERVAGPRVLEPVRALVHEQDPQPAAHAFLEYPPLGLLEGLLVVDPRQVVLVVEALPLVLDDHRHLLLVDQEVDVHRLRRVLVIP